MKKKVQNVTLEKKHTETVYTFPEGMTGKQLTQFIHENRKECSEIDETLKEETFPRGKNRKKAKGESFRKPSPVILVTVTPETPEKISLTRSEKIRLTKAIKQTTDHVDEFKGCLFPQFESGKVFAWFHGEQYTRSEANKKLREYMADLDELHLARAGKKPLPDYLISQNESK